MKKIYVLILLFSTFRLCGQSLDFVAMDENFTRVLKFHAADTVWVIYPENYKISAVDSAFVEGYFFWQQVQEKPFYSYINELLLTPDDFNRNLQFYGPFPGFKRKDILQLPIKQTDTGFSFNEVSFDSPDDAFYYMNDSATRLYTCRNSAKAPFPLRELPLGFYPLNILHGSELIINGYANGETQNLNDLETLRNRYFDKPIETRHINAYFAKAFSDEEKMEEITKSTDDFIDSLCYSLQQDVRKVPVTKVYFYEKREDLQAFLAQPLHQTIYGKSLAGNNHISGLETSVLWHELGHTVIDATIGPNPNPFWHEGFRQFTDYFKNEEAYKNDKQSTIENINTLSLELVNNTSGFFNGWHNYAISGTFVHYIIRKYGLENFIKAYRKNTFVEFFSQHNSGIENEIEAFKKSIINQ